MKIEQTLNFKKSAKKLHPNQRKDLDAAVREINQNPFIGEQKKGDLSDVRVYKFKMNKFLTLLAYSFDESSLKITLLKLGSHENFYRDL